MFLSSHILSEVEAVCDQVAILRRGRLVQVGTLDDLRHLNARESGGLRRSPRTWPAWPGSSR